MFLLRKHACGVIGRRNKLAASVHSSPVDTNLKNYTKDEKKSNEELSELCEEIADDSSKCKKAHVKVGIIGGGMTPVFTSLLLKQCKFVKSISLADTRDELAGVVRDMSQIDTATRIKYYGKSCTGEALRNVDIVALMDEKDFETGEEEEDPMSRLAKSSDYVCRMGVRMIESCPRALVIVFARPVTGTLPLLSEVYRSCGSTWDPNRIVGSLAIDSMRIESMTATLLDLDPYFLSVPIVGGADPGTVVPLLSRAKPVDHFSPEHESRLIRQLRSADRELAGLTAGGQYRGFALSSGAAAAKFIASLAGALSGRPNVVHSAYVRSDVLPFCRYFSSQLLFGCNGIEKNFGLPRVSPLAVELIERSIPQINKFSETAIETVRGRFSL